MEQLATIRMAASSYWVIWVSECFQSLLPGSVCLRPQWDCSSWPILPRAQWIVCSWGNVWTMNFLSNIIYSAMLHSLNIELGLQSPTRILYCQMTHLRKAEWSFPFQQSGFYFGTVELLLSCGAIMGLRCVLCVALLTKLNKLSDKFREGQKHKTM